MSIYAGTTSVPATKSKAEIERVLMRYGAEGFAYSNEPGKAYVLFYAQGRRVRFLLPIPSQDDFKFHTNKKTGKPDTWRPRPTRQQESMCAQAIRTCWRCLLLAIKAKLECVETGIETFEQAFLANIVLPDDRTIGQTVIPRLEDCYKTGTLLLEASP